MLLPANQLIDIISSDELNVRSEEQVFNAVMAWVKYSIQERRPQLPQVCTRACVSPWRSAWLGTDMDFFVLYRSYSMSGCLCSAPSFWWAP